MMEAILSSETLVLVRATRHHIAEDGILYASVALKVILSLVVSNHLGNLVNDCTESQHTRMALDFVQT
jgi:hypothetical protein